MFKENSLLAVADLNGNIFNPGMLWMTNSSTRFYLNQDLLFYTFPTYNKSVKPTAKIETIIAINNKSESKYTSYNLVKMLMSQDAQTNSGFMNSEGIPVNNKAIDSMIEKYTGSDGLDTIVANSKEIQGAKLPRNLGEQAKKTANDIDKCVILDQSVLQFIEEVQNFVDGKITAKETGDRINNRIQLFLSE